MLQLLMEQSWRDGRWAAESNISNCFGEIPHSGSMSAIEERIRRPPPAAAPGRCGVEPQSAAFEYIEAIYNRQRRHST